MHNALSSRALLAITLAALAVVGVRQRAKACSCLPTTVAHSEPARGARAVPLNAALVIEGLFEPESVRLEDERGSQVEVTVNRGRWSRCSINWAELIPKRMLAAHAR